MAPAALQVLMSRLVGVAEEMGAVLRRGAFSSNIKERADCSAALFTAAGDLLVQAEHIPVHLGSMPASVAAAIRSLGGEIGLGEQVVLNDPYAGGTHLNDVTLVAPVLRRWRDRRLGLRQPGPSRRPRRRHGGRVSDPLADATEIQQEGLCASRRCGSPPEVRALLAAVVTDAGGTGRRPRCPGRRQPGRGRAAGGAGPRAAGRGGGVRRAPDAGRGGGPAGRPVGVRRHPRLHRSPARPAVPGHDPGRRHQGGRARSTSTSPAPIRSARAT